MGRPGLLNNSRVAPGHVSLPIFRCGRCWNLAGVGVVIRSCDVRIDNTAVVRCCHYFPYHAPHNNYVQSDFLQLRNGCDILVSCTSAATLHFVNQTFEPLQQHRYRETRASTATVVCIDARYQRVSVSAFRRNSEWLIGQDNHSTRWMRVSAVFVSSIIKHGTSLIFRANNGNIVTKSHERNLLPTCLINTITITGTVNWAQLLGGMVLI